MKNRLLKTLVPTFIAIAACMPAMAETHVQQKVNFADLNLDKAAGVETLYRRVKTAARRVCGANTAQRRTGSIRQLGTDRQCYELAMTKAIQQIDHPQLSALYAGHNRSREDIAFTSNLSKR